MSLNSLTPEDRQTAQAIYSLLVARAGAPDGESLRAQFENFYADRERTAEFRFMGSLGYGGKIWYARFSGWSVNCYWEQETTTTRAIMARVNAALARFDSPEQAARRRR